MSFISQMHDPSNLLGLNAPTNLCDKNKKVHSVAHVLRLSLHLFVYFQILQTEVWKWQLMSLLLHALCAIYSPLLLSCNLESMFRSQNLYIFGLINTSECCI